MTAARPETVVVVGAGMVGHRFVEELASRDQDGRFVVHLVGAEEYEPYNRILLTEVLAGRASLRSLTLGAVPDRVHVHRGVSASGVDRDARQVVLDDGRPLPYDHLVLATGARAWVPPISGLEDGPQHVHVLRDLDDVRALRARAANARHAVVLGGGVLGIEAACGLAGKGIAVTVVQNEPQVMAGQLDPAPASVLAGSLAELGVRVRLGVSVAEVVAAYGELVAVRLTDGTVMAADLLLVSCGIRAETSLAADAGLPVERGVVVGSDLASPADDRVFAIGDCAQPPEGGTGLLAPGWAQAERLAARLTGGEALGVVPGAARGGREDIHTQGRRCLRGHPGGAGRPGGSRGPGRLGARPGGRAARRPRRPGRPARRRHLPRGARGGRGSRHRARPGHPDACGPAGAARSPTSGWRSPRRSGCRRPPRSAAATASRRRTSSTPGRPAPPPSRRRREHARHHGLRRLPRGGVRPHRLAARDPDPAPRRARRARRPSRSTPVTPRTHDEHTRPRR